LIVKVLGSAAGGGFPQWNCNTSLSRLAWDGDDRVPPRTQSSIAVSADGFAWVIANASPDLRQQIAANRELQPDRNGPARNSPIKAVILTNGDVDHVAGLLTLRERQPFCLYATDGVLSILKENSIFDVLAPDCVARTPLPLDSPITVAECEGLNIEAFPVPGKVPLYLETETIGRETVDSCVGLKITSRQDRTLFYIPGCAFIGEDLLQAVHGADLLLFDGTVFTDTEMIALGAGQKTGRRMGHIPVCGDGGSLHAFNDCAIGRRIYIHINTTNPILERGSEAQRIVDAAGWEVAYDGMTLEV
jgi:pyrroloquinoline quinone biosynthesis protein B